VTAVYPVLAEETDPSLKYHQSLYSEIQIGSYYVSSLSGGLNYAVILNKTPDPFHIEIRAGVGLWDGWATNGPYLVCTVNLLTGKHSNHLEIVLGQGLMIEKDYMNSMLLVNIGYRYQNPEKRFLFKVTCGT